MADRASLGDSASQADRSSINGEVLDAGKKAGKKKKSVFGKLFKRKGKAKQEEDAEDQSPENERSPQLTAASLARNQGMRNLVISRGDADSGSVADRSSVKSAAHERGSLTSADESAAERNSVAASSIADNCAPGSKTAGGVATATKESSPRKNRRGSRGSDRGSARRRSRDSADGAVPAVDPSDPDFAIFAKFDTNLSGEVAAVDVGKLIKGCGLSVSQIALDETMAALNIDSKGALTFPAFKSILEHLRAQKTEKIAARSRSAEKDTGESAGRISPKGRNAQGSKHKKEGERRTGRHSSQTQETKDQTGTVLAPGAASRSKKDTDKKRRRRSTGKRSGGDAKKSGKDGDESVGKVGGDSAIEAAAAAAISSATLTQDNMGAASASTATQEQTWRAFAQEHKLDRFSDRLTQCPKSVDELCAMEQTDLGAILKTLGISLAGRHRVIAALQQHHRTLEMAKVKAQSAAAVTAEAGGVTTPAEVPVNASQKVVKAQDNSLNSSVEIAGNAAVESGRQDTLADDEASAQVSADQQGSGKAGRRRRKKSVAAQPGSGGESASNSAQQARSSASARDETTSTNAVAALRSARTVRKKKSLAGTRDSKSTQQIPPPPVLKQSAERIFQAFDVIGNNMMDRLDVCVALQQTFEGYSKQDVPQLRRTAPTVSEHPFIEIEAPDESHLPEMLQSLQLSGDVPQLTQLHFTQLVEVWYSMKMVDHLQTTAAAQNAKSGVTKRLGTKYVGHSARPSVGHALHATDFNSSSDSKQRKKSLAAVDHNELVRQLENVVVADAIADSDSILPVSERVQFTEEDERRFSLAGYLARKKHARDDKEARLEHDSNIGSLDMLTTEDLPNYALDALESSHQAHTRRTTRYGRSGHPSASIDAELLAELSAPLSASARQGGTVNVESVCREAFQQFSIDGSMTSKVPMDKVRSAMCIVGDEPSLTEMQALLVDADSSGLSFAHFVRIVQQHRGGGTAATSRRRGSNQSFRRPSNTNTEFSSVSSSRKSARRRDSDGRASVHSSVVSSSIRGRRKSRERKSSRSSVATSTFSVSPEDVALYELFKRYDNDGSGTIDQEELTNALRKCGYAPTPQQVLGLLQEVDDDDSGEIDWPEFSKLMQKLKLRRGQMKMLGDNADLESVTSSIREEGAAPAVNKRGRRMRKARVTPEQTQGAILIQRQIRKRIAQQRVKLLRQNQLSVKQALFDEYKTSITGVLLSDTLDARAREFIEQQRNKCGVTPEQHQAIVTDMGWTPEQIVQGSREENSHEQGGGAAHSDESDLLQWLTEHKLQKHFEMIHNSEMGLEGLLDMEEEELKEFLIEIELPAGARKRMILAIKHSAGAQKDEQAMDEWLVENNFVKYKEVLRENEVTLDSMIDMEADELKSFLVEIALPVGARQRFIKALKKTAAQRKPAPTAGNDNMRDDGAASQISGSVAPERAKILAQFQGTLHGILVDGKMSHEQHKYIQEQRLKNGINDAELKTVLQELDWSMERFDALAAAAKSSQTSGRINVMSDGESDDGEGGKTSRWGLKRGKKAKKKRRSSGRETRSAEIVVATLGTGPLGITLQRNSCGPDISAVVQEVAGAAKAEGNIRPGQFIVAINQDPCSKYGFNETLGALKDATRPLTLLLASPALPQDPDIVACYIADDPTKKFPEKVGLYLHEEGSVSDYGVQIVSPESGMTICLWTWRMIISSTHKLQTDGPDAMELLCINVKGLGRFSFEANSFSEFATVLDKRLTLHPHAEAEETRDLGVYTVTLGSGPLGLSVEQNKNGPNISAIIDGVSGAAAKTGKISVGDMLVSINGSCMTDFSFIEVLDELKQASRPVELTFVAPPSPSNPDLFPCYTIEDPTHGLPESVKLLVRRDTGLQIVDTDIGATVAFFPWQMMPSCHSEMPRRGNPQLVLETNVGTIVFEASETDDFASLVQSRIEDSLGARRMSRAARQNGSIASVVGGSQEIVEVQLGEGPLGLSLEPNPFGPDHSAVVEELLPGGQAAMTGEIERGQYLLSINKNTTLTGNYNSVMTALRNAERPLLLSLVNPITRSALSELPRAYPVNDPTNDFPEECVFQLLDEGLHVGDAANGATVAFFMWKQVKQWKPQVGDSDDAMEVFMLVIAGMGIFSFEMNDAYTFADDLERAVQDADDAVPYDD